LLWNFGVRVAQTRTQLWNRSEAEIAEGKAVVPQACGTTAFVAVFDFKERASPANEARPLIHTRAVNVVRNYFAAVFGLKVPFSQGSP
jgi:hypothetical protein